MRRILLVNPPAGGKLFIREGRCMNRQSAWESVWPPLTLMYLSAIMRKAGYATLIADSNTESPRSLERKIAEFRPELSIVNTSTPTIASDIRFAEGLKEKVSSKVALMGTHPTATDREILETSEIDFIVRGEPELTCLELAHELSRGGKKLAKVAGLSWKRRNGPVVRNKDRKFITDLDKLPFPDRESVDNSKYRMPLSGEPFAIVNTARGCPYGCTFCVASLFYGKAFRKRSARSIASEVELCVREHGIRNFLFWADEFTFDRRQVLELCGELTRRKLGISWFSNSRVDSADYSLFREMKRAGCFLVSFGIESASQEILDNVKKRTTVGRALAAVRDAKKAGLEVIGHFIFGLPGETRETARATIELAKRSGVDYAQFYIATPYPGTPFYEHCLRNGLIVEGDFSKMEISRAAIRQGALSAKDLLGLRRRAYFEFYLRPGYLFPRAVGILSKNGLRGISDAFRYFSDWGAFPK